jgi:hypothetical protein
MLQPDSHWDDGPCRTCKCEGTAARGYHPVCKVQTCSDLSNEKEGSEYELEKVLVPNQCCPSIVRTACKEADTVHKVRICSLWCQCHFRVSSHAVFGNCCINCWAVHVFLKAVFCSQQQSSERTQTSIPPTNNIVASSHKSMDSPHWQRRRLHWRQLQERNYAPVGQ